MMKNIYLTGIAIVLIAMASCRKGSFLDNKSTASLNQEITFADSANTMNFLAGLYVDVGYSFPALNDAGKTPNNYQDFADMCDEGEGRYPAAGNFDKVVTMGTFADTYFNQTENFYSLFYADIRNINIFLANVDKSPLSAAKKTRTKAEARFLRAYYYAVLTKYYGGVPLIGDQIFDVAEKGTLVRGTYEQCVNYMVSELDAIADKLPVSYSGLDYGRVTKGACLALKSRILLYAASPLYNGGAASLTTGIITNPVNAKLLPLLGYPTADANRWAKARDAARAVMDMGVYELFTDNTTKWSGAPATGNTNAGFYKLFITRVNNEMIFCKPTTTSKVIEIYFNPKSRGGADFYYYPTQEMVDKFPTIKGLPITSDIYNATTNPTGYNAANPYANRDPRLTATIIYNGSMYFLNSSKALAPVNTYVGASPDGIVGISVNSATITGYYVRKMSDENAAVTGGNNVDRSLPLIRYAEILLNYAEASNEMGNTTEAINTLKLLRQRAGILPGVGGMYGLPTAASKEDARAVILNERAIELAYEGHRFFDIRRWKLGPDLDGAMLHGMQITKSGSNYTYNRITVRTR